MKTRRPQQHAGKRGTATSAKPAAKPARPGRPGKPVKPAKKVSKEIAAALDRYHKVSEARRAEYARTAEKDVTGGPRKERALGGAPGRRLSRPGTAEVSERGPLQKSRRPALAKVSGASGASKSASETLGRRLPVRRRKPAPVSGPAIGPAVGPVRLQKVLAQAGIASRRHIEELIMEGAITVNGKTAEPGCKVDPARDVIKINGKPVRLVAEQKVYLVLNKPRGFITTTSDPEARDTVMGLLKGIKLKVKPVGRLDIQTEGLLLFTNDGDLTNAVTHPARELPKTYKVKVDGVMDEADFDKLRKGVRLADGLTAPALVKPLKKTATNSWVEITIHEGRNRQVRRMCEHLGHSVLKLKRIAVGPISLGQLPLGAWRYLTPREVELLKQAVS